MKPQAEGYKKRNRGSREPQYSIPQVDIFETAEEFVLQADMPGVGKDGVQISLDGSELCIFGRRIRPFDEKPSPSRTFLQRESVSADFRRVFVLDPVIDTSRITAQMDQGVLTVHLPKAEKHKPRLIPVTD